MTKHILFVDDEQRILDGIRRMLRAQRRQWSLHFAPGGREALEILAREPIDIIVSDMRMPHMTGVELLTKVRDVYPQVIRIALSGHASRETVLRCVGPVHQYLPKPTDTATLKTTIEGTYALREFLGIERLRGLVTQLEGLPSLPMAYARLMEQAQAPDLSLSELTETISQDLAMSAKVMQLANSAFFGAADRISTVRNAVAHLGIDTVRTLALSVHIFSEFDRQYIEAFSLDGLWQHALIVAETARRIAKAEGLPAAQIDQTYLAAMLHDIGKLVLASALPEEYTAALARARDGGLAPWRGEAEQLGTTHAETGAYLLGLWGFAPPVIRATAYHHAPQQAPAGDEGILAMIHVATALSHDSAEIDLEFLKRIGFADRLPAWTAVHAAANRLEEAG